MASTVNIEGVDKKELLHRLWLGARPASVYTWVPEAVAPEWNNDQAEAILCGRGPAGYYADYLCGRCIKTDFATGVVDVCFYDREYGEGAFARVVESFWCKK